MMFHRFMPLSFSNPCQGLSLEAWWWRIGSDGSLCEA